MYLHGKTRIWAYLCPTDSGMQLPMLSRGQRCNMTSFNISSGRLQQPQR